MERLRECSTIGCFVFLDQTRHDINDTLTVLGCTLFSEVAAGQCNAVTAWTKVVNVYSTEFGVLKSIFYFLFFILHYVLRLQVLLTFFSPQQLY